MRRVTVAGILVLGLAGTAWAQTPVPVDGVYDGGSSIIGSAAGRAAQGRCNQTMSFKLHVRDRSFVWKLPTGQVPVTVAPDGSFAAQNGSRFLNGRIQGTHFAAQTTGRGCNYTWSLDRQ